MCRFAAQIRCGKRFNQRFPKTADAYDHILNAYLGEYRKGGVSEKRYSDIDAFVMDYLN
jgi:hypothetical protein